MSGSDLSVRRLILTGAPGSGKTSVLMVLRSRGYDAVEIDQIGPDRSYDRPVSFGDIVL